MIYIDLDGAGCLNNVQNTVEVFSCCCVNVLQIVTVVCLSYFQCKTQSVFTQTALELLWALKCIFSDKELFS